MITYFIIGIIVQLAIIAERTIRIPGIWNTDELKRLDFWVGLFSMFIVNVLLWPLTIVCEIFAIIYGI